MTAYIIRRILYGIPIILGVLLLLFAIFFLYADTETMARDWAAADEWREKIRAAGFEVEDRPDGSLVKALGES